MGLNIFVSKVIKRDEEEDWNGKGHNLISCCHKCKVQLYSFRGEEDIAMLDFYKKHAECAKKDINNVQTVMDNNSTDQEWMCDGFGKTPKYEDDSLQP